MENIYEIFLFIYENTSIVDFVTYRKNLRTYLSMPRVRVALYIKKEIPIVKSRASINNGSL